MTDKEYSEVDEKLLEISQALNKLSVQVYALRWKISEMDDKQIKPKHELWLHQEPANHDIVRLKDPYFKTDEEDRFGSPE